MRSSCRPPAHLGPALNDGKWHVRLALSGHLLSREVLHARTTLRSLYLSSISCVGRVEQTPACRRCHGRGLPFGPRSGTREVSHEKIHDKHHDKNHVACCHRRIDCRCVFDSRRARRSRRRWRRISLLPRAAVSTEWASQRVSWSVGLCARPFKTLLGPVAGYRGASGYAPGHKFKH